jgi:hypothetical protein
MVAQLRRLLDGADLLRRVVEPIVDNHDPSATGDE